jgi:hypothetical protein
MVPTSSREESEEGTTMIAGFLFGLGLIAAFVVVANIEVIVMVALGLITAAVAIGAAILFVPSFISESGQIVSQSGQIIHSGAVWIGAHPLETVGFIVGMGLIFGVPLALVVGMGKLHNWIASRIDPKHAEWIMIGVFLSLPFLLGGSLIGFAYLVNG